MCKILKTKIYVYTCIFEMALFEWADIDIGETLKSQQIVLMTKYLILISFSFFQFLHVLLLQVQEPI